MEPVTAMVMSCPDCGKGIAIKENSTTWDGSGMIFSVNHRCRKEKRRAPRKR